MSGLSAAYFLHDRDFLLLEKESHWGGNATLEEFSGQMYATGSAFDYKGSASEQLACSPFPSILLSPPSSTAIGLPIRGAPASISSPTQRPCAKASRSFERKC